MSFLVAMALAGALEQVQGFGTNPGALVMHRQLPVNAQGPVSVVMVLHGCSQDARAFAESSGWLQLASDGNFALIAPEQTSANNPQRCFNWFVDGDITRGQGEAESLRQMIAHTQAAIPVDRVFITGLSSGGAMTAVMLAAYPEVFSAGAVMSGVAYRCGVGLTEAFACMQGGRALDDGAWGQLVRNASSHPGPWPRVSLWQGAEDSTVNAANLENLVSQWTNVHGVSAPSTETLGRDQVRRWGTAVEAHRIDGMGHGAALDPDVGCGQAAAFMLDVDVCSTRRIADFFGLMAPAPVSSSSSSSVMPSSTSLASSASVASSASASSSTSEALSSSSSAAPSEPSASGCTCAGGAPDVSLLVLAGWVFRRRNAWARGVGG